MAGSSKLAVTAAIGGNTIVATAKFAAFAFTGSGSMLSEAIHSVADVLNQVLLLVGVVRAEKGPDQQFPYGHARERYVWALMSAVGIFFLGCGVTIYHGIQGLMHPHALEDLGWALAVLGFSFAIEFAVLMLAVRGLRRDAGDRPFAKYLREEAGPSALAVLAEDSVACLGIIIAFVCILIAKFTGQTYWDAIGSIAIGILLGAVAIWLIVRNHRSLVGPSVPSDIVDEVRELVVADEAVEYIAELKGQVLDAKTYDFALEVEFNGEVIAERLEPGLEAAWEKIEDLDDFKAFAQEYAHDVVDALGDQVNELEDQIRRQVPQAVHVDIESN